MIGLNFVTTFFPKLNVGSFIHIKKFGITFKKKLNAGIGVLSRKTSSQERQIKKMVHQYAHG